MSNPNVILISGVSAYWGFRVAKRLISIGGHRVIGIDSIAPAEEIEDLDFVQIDISNPMLSELLDVEQVDTVCHLQFREMPDRDEPDQGIDVASSIIFLDAAAKTGVRNIVFRSSTSVYGAHSDNPAFITENMPLRGSRYYGNTRDLLELEAFLNGFRRQNPEIALTVLRFANIVGTSVDSPMTRYLRLRPPITLLGFDPIMQFIHEDDVTEALVHAIVNETSGIYNVAAEGAMPLSRTLRLVKKMPLHVFHPIAYKGFNLFSRIYPGKLKMAPIEWDYLRYSWVSDLSKMHDEFEFEPVYLAQEALREFARSLENGKKRKIAESVADDEDRIRDIIEQRKRMKARELTET